MIEDLKAMLARWRAKIEEVDDPGTRFGISCACDELEDFIESHAAEQAAKVDQAMREIEDLAASAEAIANDPQYEADEVERIDAREHARSYRCLAHRVRRIFESPAKGGE